MVTGGPGANAVPPVVVAVGAGVIKFNNTPDMAGGVVLIMLATRNRRAVTHRDVLWTAEEIGVPGVHVLKLVVVACRLAHTTSNGLQRMADMAAHILLVRSTVEVATQCHAPWIVMVSGPNGVSARRPVALGCRRNVSLLQFRLNMEVPSVKLLMGISNKSPATKESAPHHFMWLMHMVQPETMFNNALVGSVLQMSVILVAHSAVQMATVAGRMHSIFTLMIMRSLGQLSIMWHTQKVHSVTWCPLAPMECLRQATMIQAVQHAVQLDTVAGHLISLSGPLIMR